MDIIVCIKAVCMNPISFTISDDGERIDCGSRSLVMNEADEYALEQALVMKSEMGGTVTVIVGSGLPAQDILYAAKAKGVDRAIRASPEYSDPISMSGVLAKVIEGIHFDLILAGSESSDNMSGQTGICLAERLSLPFAYAVTAINAKSTSGSVRVKKELGGGIYQIMDICLPALLCVQSGIQPLKYTPPAKIIRARKELLEVCSLEAGALNTITPTQPIRPKLKSLFKPEVTRKAEVLSGKPAEIAPVVIKKILEVR